MYKRKILTLSICLILLFSCVFVLSACDDVEKVTFKESDFYGTWVYVWDTMNYNRADSVEFLNKDGQLTVKFDNTYSMQTLTGELKGNSVFCKDDNYSDGYVYRIFTMDDSKSFITMTILLNESVSEVSTAKFCSDYSYANRN